MHINIMKAEERHKDTFIQLTAELSKFNRSNHQTHSKYDDYESVLSSIRKKAAATFECRKEDTLILIAEIGGAPMGYALGRIFREEGSADNGTGRTGLLDELYVDDKARGFGIGRKLIEQIIHWMKKNEVTRIKLHAYSWNETAKKLYEKHGFKEYAVSYEKFI